MRHDTEDTLNEGKNDLASRMMRLMQDIAKWEPEITRALRAANGAYLFDDIVELVLQQRLHFYDYGTCFVFMAVESFPQHKNFHCFLAGGNFDDLVQVAERDLAIIARELGCKHLTFSGRRGFERTLKNHGWAVSRVFMQKEIG